MIGDGSVLAEEKKPCQRCRAHLESNPDSFEASYRPTYPMNEQRHRKRHAGVNGEGYMKSNMYIDAKDGPLDSESYYTAFLDAIG